MTHQAHPSVVNDAVQMLAEHGFEGLAQTLGLLFNSA
jgi:hypothetical protein